MLSRAIMVGLLFGPSSTRFCSRWIGLVWCAALLWSPFVAAGALPFVMFSAVKSRDARNLLNVQNVSAILLCGGPVLLYLTRGAAKIPVAAGWSPESFSWGTLGLFLLLEVSIPIAAIWFAGTRRVDLLCLACGALLLIPLLRMGAANDWTMRVSLPSLAVIAMLAGNALAEGRFTFRKAPLLCIFIVGALTPMAELAGRFKGFASVHPLDADHPENYDLSRYSGQPLLHAQLFAPPPGFILKSSIAVDGRIS